MPPEDYLKGSRRVTIPDAGRLVSELSSKAIEAGFVVPAYFAADTLENAIRGRIVEAGRCGSPARLATALRECLRLIGDAIVYMLATDADYVWPSVLYGGVLPIVDTGLGSPREDMLHTLLERSFSRTSGIQRGGVLMGFKGFGKSQIVLNVVLGRQLVGWALKGKGFAGWKTHIGMMLSGPAGDVPCQMNGAPATAILAAGLHEKRVLADPKVPNWAVPGDGAFDATVA